MPENNKDQQLNEAKGGLKVAGKAGEAAAKGTAKAVKTEMKIIPPPWNIVVLVALIALILIGCLVAGSNDSSFRRVLYKTAIREALGLNNPKTEEEIQESLYEKDTPISDTVELIMVIDEAKMDDYADVDKVVEDAVASANAKWIRSGHASIDKDLSISQAKRETADGNEQHYAVDSSMLGAGGYSGNAAEAIAQTSERFAWPLNTNKDKYSVSKGSPHGDFAAVHKKLYPHYQGDDHGACCCHFARTCVAAALGLNEKTLPISFMSNGASLSQYNKKVGKYGFEATKWSGDMSDLRRGDIIAMRGNITHVMIYLGDNKVAEASNLRHLYGHVAKISKRKASLAGKESYYIVRPTAKLEAKVADGNTLPADAPNLTTYTKQTEIAKIKKNNGKKMNLVQNSACQSFAMNGTNYFVQRISGGSGGYVEEYDATGKYIKKSSYMSELRHGNGLTFCPKDGLLYSVTCVGFGNNTYAYKIDPSTLKLKGGVHLPCEASGIAYDESTGWWAISSGGKIRIYDSDMKKKKGAGTINKKGKVQAAQDIAAYNGIVYVCTFRNYGKGTGNNWVDMYSMKTGDYYGGYSVDYDEIESVCFSTSGKMVLLMNAGTDYMQETDITAYGGLTAFGSATGISKLDMDILSAYNIMLSNNSMYLDESKLEESVPKDGATSEAYTDINGQKVSVYWFGKNRGKINYKKDLKKRVDSLFKHSAITYDRDTGSTSSSSGASVDSSDWKMLLVNNDNALPDGYSPSLATISDSYTTHSGSQIDSRIYDSLMSMINDCEAAGYSAKIVSAYRSTATQQSLYDSTANKNDTARPGHSEHEYGLAADIVDSDSLSWSDPLIDEQENMPAQKWLMEHCQDYGFILRYPKGKQESTGIIYEPWHYRYVGKKAAKEIMSKGICLEEYLKAGKVSSSSSSSEEDDKIDDAAIKNKHFFDVIVGTEPVEVDATDENGNVVKKKILPVTIKERGVEELMPSLFGLDPKSGYVNSKGIRGEKIKEGQEDKENPEYEDYARGKASATNLDATYTLSDNTGRTLFGELQDGAASEVSAYAGFSLYGNGALKFPLPPEYAKEKWITSRFTYGKMRTDVSTGSSHDGLDIGAPEGTPIYAAASGTVTTAEYWGGFGNLVVVKSGNTEIYYAHQSKILCKKGDMVSAGQLLGLVGNTGRSTGAHLHIGVKVDGKWQNPEPLLGF